MGQEAAATTTPQAPSVTPIRFMGSRASDAMPPPTPNISKMIVYQEEDDDVAIDITTSRNDRRDSGSERSSGAASSSAGASGEMARGEGGGAVVKVQRHSYRSAAIDGGARKNKRGTKKRPHGSSRRGAAVVSSECVPSSLLSAEIVSARYDMDRFSSAIEAWVASTRVFTRGIIHPSQNLLPTSNTTSTSQLTASQLCRVKEEVTSSSSPTAVDAACSTAPPQSAPSQGIKEGSEAVHTCNIPNEQVPQYDQQHASTHNAEEEEETPVRRECSPVADEMEMPQSQAAEANPGEPQPGPLSLGMALCRANAVNERLPLPAGGTSHTHTPPVAARVGTALCADVVLGSLLAGSVGEVFPIVQFNGEYVGSLSAADADLTLRRVAESCGNQLRRPLHVDDFDVYFYVVPPQRAVWSMGSSTPSGGEVGFTPLGDLYRASKPNHIETLIKVMGSPACRKVVVDGQQFLYRLLLALGGEGSLVVSNTIDLHVADYLFPDVHLQHRKPHPRTDGTATITAAASVLATEYHSHGGEGWMVAEVEARLIPALQQIYAHIGWTHCVPISIAEEVSSTGPRAQVFSTLLRESAVAHCCALMEFNGLYLDASAAIETLDTLQKRSVAIHALLDEILEDARQRAGLQYKESSSPIRLTTTHLVPLAPATPNSKSAGASAEGADDSRQHVLTRKRLHTPEDRLHAILAMPSILIEETPISLSVDIASTPSEMSLTERIPLTGPAPPDLEVLRDLWGGHGGARQYINALLSSMVPLQAGESLSTLSRTLMRSDPILLWYCPAAALWAELSELKDTGTKLQQLLKRYQSAIGAKMELDRCGVVFAQDSEQQEQGDDDEVTKSLPLSGSCATRRLHRLLVDLHPLYNADSSTGRIFASNPNVQTIPAAVYPIGMTPRMSATSNDGEGSSSRMLSAGQVLLVNRLWRELRPKGNADGVSPPLAANASTASDGVGAGGGCEDVEGTTPPTSTPNPTIKPKRIQVVEEENTVTVGGRISSQVLYQQEQQAAASKIAEDDNAGSPIVETATSVADRVDDSSVGVKEGAIEESAIPRMLRPRLVSVRRFYCGPPRCVIVSMDYDQIELRMLAHHSRDPNMITALGGGNANAAGQQGDGEQQPRPVQPSDILKFVASKMFGVLNAADVTPAQRQAAKVVTYGLMYGLGDAALQARLPNSPPKQQSTTSSPSHISPATPASEQPIGDPPGEVASMSPSHTTSMATLFNSVVVGADEKAKEGSPPPPSTAPSSPSSSHQPTTSQGPPQAITAAYVRAAFKMAFPVAYAYLEDVASSAIATGEARTLGGRVRHFSLSGGGGRDVPNTSTGVGTRRPRDTNASLWSIKTKAVATVIQGSAADILKGAMVACVACINSPRCGVVGEDLSPLPPCRLVSSVHDELLFGIELPTTNSGVPGDYFLEETINKLHRCMVGQATHFGLRVPLTVSVKVGETLGSLTPYLPPRSPHIPQST